MKEPTPIIISFLMIVLSACGTPIPRATPTPTSALVTVSNGAPTVVAATGYRPLQSGDVVEGQTIAYQYVLPTNDQPAVILAFGANLLQLFTFKKELQDGFLAYFQELGKYKNIQGFDESDPNQTVPKPITWDASKPVEIAFIYLPDASSHHWSVTEGENGEVYAAYKFVRRKDGGLRFIDAYGTVALNSANNTFTLNGGGGGLMLSSRLALLRLLMSDPQYQTGYNVMTGTPPGPSEYDPRVLKIDPTKTGLLMDQDWILVSRPGPTGGQLAP